MRVLNTLYVTSHRARLTSDRGTLLVADPEAGRQRVPLETLDAVVLLGAAQVSTRLMAECVRRSIRITSLQRSGAVRFAVGGGTRGNVYLRLAQLRAADDADTCMATARTLVAGKLQNCRRMLQRWSWDAEPRLRWSLVDNREAIERRILSLPGATDGDRIRGVEGDGSRRYFRGMRAALWGCGFEFRARTRRPPLDPVNCLLGFVYGLLLGEVVGAIEATGLDPQVGFLHGVRPGRPALGLDLLEELRPAMADRLVVRLLRRRQVSDATFRWEPGGACLLSDDGRTDILAAYERYRETEVPHPFLDRDVPRWCVPQIQANLMARYLRGDLPEYVPFLVVT